MELLYWGMEYGKVLGAYLFLMFLWPLVVFRRHLREKNIMYRFSFCVTVQIVLVSTVVLIPGLFHLLNQKAVAVGFYGVFLAALWPDREERQKLAASVRGIRFRFTPRIDRWFRGIFWDLWWKKGTKLFEYGILAVVVAFGMAYFSYGAFQIHSYGGGDLYSHHAWIYGLIQGQIFADGVYPEAMHCFVYCIHVLFGIRVDSILLFLQNIHVAVFLLSAYFLMRQVFHWRYTPVFVLALFLTLDVVSADEIYAMYRLQLALPLEFGLHTQFLCALYLVRYLKYHVPEEENGRKKRAADVIKIFRNEDLFLFTASLAASIATHYYTTIMAFIVCCCFSVFALKRLLNRKYLLPVVAATLCGVLVPVVPMAGALASGIPFNYSITWAVNVMDGEEARKLQEEVEAEETAADTETGEKSERTGILPEQAYRIVKSELGLEPKTLSGIYEMGYETLYGKTRAVWVVGLTVAAVALCLAGRKRSLGFLREITEGYPPVILLSFLFVLLYAAPFMGLPELISDSRFCSTGHMVILAVMAMPLDALFSGAAAFGVRKGILEGISLAVPVMIYGLTLLTGTYHGYLFYELTRYNSAVAVTNSIIETFPKGRFVVVAPTDELYPVIPYGWHEELLNFVKNSESGEYSLPSDYIFIYVEKKPFQYSQAHFFTGPSWLGSEKYQEIYWKKYSKKYPEKGSSQAPGINTSEISEADMQIPAEKIDKGWQTYTMLENRTVLEAKAWDWCRRFSEKYPLALKVYYEDKDFICYYLKQEPGEPLYGLGIE